MAVHHSSLDSASCLLCGSICTACALYASLLNELRTLDRSVESELFCPEHTTDSASRASHVPCTSRLGHASLALSKDALGDSTTTLTLSERSAKEGSPLCAPRLLWTLRWLVVPSRAWAGRSRQPTALVLRPPRLRPLVDWRGEASLRAHEKQPLGGSGARKCSAPVSSTDAA